MTEEINYREWIDCEPINFDPRSKEEKEATICKQINSKDEDEEE